ncbi:hypothetical protein BD413DRAFT_604494 [Trametes elegans]|nr:hypothetical protein BD413DRAFT_604494 [Trametes elegans]
MAQPIIYSTPPLAGKPPFATDEPDSVYDQHQHNQTRRMRQQPPANPNDRTSAYNVYDQYIDEKKDNPFDDSKQMHPQPAIPLAAPQPGYAAPVAALNLSRPAPAAAPNGRPPASPEMSEFQGSMPTPMVPIAPVFARPSTATSRDVKFASKPIMRGDTEDTVLPRRGQKGDDFWRRFSMVAKEDIHTGKKQSWWLHKTQSGTTRMSRWVWIVGMTLLIVIAGAIGLGWYVGHNSTSHNAPKAIGGSANEKAIASETSTIGSGLVESASPTFHVSPTHTVARRAPIPSSPPSNIYHFVGRGGSSHHVNAVQIHRPSRRSPLNRTSH